MFIIFDPGEHGVFYVSDGAVWERMQHELDRAGELLEVFVRLLNSRMRSLSDVSGLGVISGRGTFTATRVSITLVNTLAFAHNIPVIAFSNLPDPTLVSALFAAHKTHLYIQAQYSAEPRIHIKKLSEYAL